MAQIERFAHAVIGRAVERNICGGQSTQRIRETCARRINNRQMKQAGAARRRRRAAKTFPGVESDVVVIAAGGNKRRLAPVSLGEFETEHATVEPESTLQVKGFTNLWAVGFSQNSSSGPEQALIEHWNGTTWQVAASPNPGVGSDLQGVARVPGATNLWAVGQYATSSSLGKTLTEFYG